MLIELWNIVVRQNLVMEAMKNAIQILEHKFLRSQETAISSQEQVIKAQQLAAVDCEAVSRNKSDQCDIQEIRGEEHL